MAFRRLLGSTIAHRWGMRACTVLVLVLVVAIALPEVPPARAASQEPELGFHVHRGDAEHLQAARDGGASFVVLVFSWRDMEPVQSYHYWETTDAALRAAEYYDLEVVARLDQPPDWALVDDGPAPWDVDAYGAFVRRVAERYGDRLAGLIVWNEPNLALEWNGERPDPAGYAALLRAAYAASKAASPELPVLLAGLAFTEGDGDLSTNDLEYLQALYDIGIGDAFDVLAAHAYGFGRPPEETPAEDRLNFRRLELHRALMDEYGDTGKPIWITEMGWRTAAPNPADAWQVVSDANQAAYTLGALDYASEQWPWLDRLAFWELNADADGYGYAFWQGTDRVSQAYTELAGLPAVNLGQSLDTRSGRASDAPVEILAADAIVRLGDRGELHPHWVHLRGEPHIRLSWTAEFFLSPQQAAGSHVLLIETMQVDQPTNRLFLNGTEFGRLEPRTRPDPTSTWVTQRFPVPPGALRTGVNRLTLDAGLRSPVRQYAWWRSENLQVRNVRLEPATDGDAGLPATWEPLPSPGSWAEVHRLRLVQDEHGQSLWVLVNRRGQMYRIELTRDGAAARVIDERMGADLVFLDVAVLANRIIAATDRGLYERESSGDMWQAASGAPVTQAHTVLAHQDSVYAGFEANGVWRLDADRQLWRQDGLRDRTVTDLAVTPSGELYAATDKGVFVRNALLWRPLPPLPDAYVTRIFAGENDAIIARVEDRLWQYDAENGWSPYGPEPLQGRAFAVIDCCEQGRTWIATNHRGLWQQLNDESWQRIDGDTFSDLELTGGVNVGETTYVAADNGLYSLKKDERIEDDLVPVWHHMLGLASTVTDLLISRDGSTWLAGTPSGVWRSVDSGRTWQAISPPWIVWEIALGPEGRLYIARDDGLAYTDSWAEESVVWTESDGLDSVTFFDASPHPAVDGLLWAGTWGNNVGVSVDGGASIRPLHNGLETLSVLDVLWHVAPGQATVATIEGMYRTDDGGATWFKLPGPLTSQTVYALHQTEEGSILAGAADGLWVSTDYGAAWFRLEDLPAVTVLRIGEFDRGAESLLWAGTEGGGLWLSEDSGASWQHAGLDGHSVYAVQTLTNGQVIAATDHGLHGVQVPRRP